LELNDQQANGNGGNDNGSSDNGGNAKIRGISVETLTPDLAQQIGVSSNLHGVVVDNVDADSPAADANLTRGVVITSVDRHPVSNVQDFRRLMAAAQGKPVLLSVNGGGSNIFIVVQP
jgi:S1-C subfamily serine protease